MSTFRDKFQDPQWLAKREALLERAGHECENCHTTQDLLVHIGGFEPGVEPWEYPDEAYRCLCRVHHEQRKRSELDLRRCCRALDEAALDSVCDALSYLAALPQGERSVAAERLYVAAKHEPRFADEED